MTLLYPSLNYSEKYAQDHIHPKSGFHKTRMEEVGFSDEEIQSFKAEMNKISNLELLPEILNQEKLSTPFQEWIGGKYPTGGDRGAFLQRHYIGMEQSLDFKYFLDFIAHRREKLKAEFEKILGVSSP